MEAGCSFETSMNVHQNIRRHIPESPDFNTAGRRRRLEDILQAILKKWIESLGKGAEMAQFREEL